MRHRTWILGLVASGSFFVSSGQAVDDECRVALAALQRQQAALRQELAQREETIRALTETLAIARTESELFQRRWAEARLRAEAVGVNFGEANTTQLQRQVIESVRSLHLAEAERARLLAQLQRLQAAAMAGGTNLAAELERARQVVTESAQPAAASPATPGRLEAARIVEINASLRVVVLDVGSLQGVRVGMPFAVRRGGRVIGAVRVVEVRPRICGALIEKTEKGQALEAGDRVGVTSG